MYLKIFIILSFTSITNLLAQDKDVKIIEILDANLFKTEDSVLIRMSNLKVPSLSDPDSARRDLAKKIIKYADLHLLDRTSRFIVSPKKSCSEKSIQSGHLFRKYPLSETNINEAFLEKGYAVYLPCDTLFMDDYSQASEKAITKKKGFWSPIREIKKPDYFNRLRGTIWHYQPALENDNYFPIFGFNYRWSNLYPLVEYNSTNLNLSAEAGTFILFFLPYVNLGSEFRYKKFYVRGHYDVLLPIFIGADGRSNAFDFYGFDAGFIISIGKRSGIEIEVNLKNVNKDTYTLMSISFVSY